MNNPHAKSEQLKRDQELALHDFIKSFEDVFPESLKGILWLSTKHYKGPFKNDVIFFGGRGGRPKSDGRLSYVVMFFLFDRCFLLKYTT